jgi:hypothetical protein
MLLENKHALGEVGDELRRVLLTSLQRCRRTLFGAGDKQSLIDTKGHAEPDCRADIPYADFRIATS